MQAIANQSIAFLSGIGSSELLIILVIVLLLFGSKKLPELARGLGKSMREFKKATTDIEEDFREAMEAEPQPTASSDKKAESGKKDGKETSEKKDAKVETAEKKS